MRYVDKNVDKNGEICKDMLKFIHCKSGLADKDLFKEVFETLNELGFDDIKYCQGKLDYSAGAVRGVLGGLPPLILKKNEKYAHCGNHVKY